LSLPRRAATDLSSIFTGNRLANGPEAGVDRWNPGDYRALRRRTS